MAHVPSMQIENKEDSQWMEEDEEDEDLYQNSVKIVDPKGDGGTNYRNFVDDAVRMKKRLSQKGTESEYGITLKTLNGLGIFPLDQVTEIVNMTRWQRQYGVQGHYFQLHFKEFPFWHGKKPIVPSLLARLTVLGVDFCKFDNDFVKFVEPLIGHLISATDNMERVWHQQLESWHSHVDRSNAESVRTAFVFGNYYKFAWNLRGIRGDPRNEFWMGAYLNCLPIRQIIEDAGYENVKVFECGVEKVRPGTKSSTAKQDGNHTPWDCMCILFILSIT